MPAAGDENGPGRQRVAHLVEVCVSGGMDNEELIWPSVRYAASCSVQSSPASSGLAGSMTSSDDGSSSGRRCRVLATA